MPVYEYKCKDCGEVFDMFFFTAQQDVDKNPCPKCNGTEVSKLMSVFGSCDSSSSGGCSPEGGFT